MRGARRGVVLAAAAILLSSCSAADFKEPIGAFSKATTAAASSFADYQKVIDAASSDHKLVAAAQNTLINVREEPGTCRDKYSHCRLQVKLSDGWHYLGTEPTAPQIQKLMDGLVAYAATLTAIASADTAGDVKSALGAAKASITNLATAGDALAKQVGRPANLTSSVSALSGPVTDVVNFALTQYLEQVKLDALKTATNKMNKLFPRLVPLFGDVGSTAVGIKVADLEKAYVDAKNTSHTDPTSQSKLQAWEAAATAYDAALSTSPTKIFTDLMLAHTSLTAALNSPTPTFDEVWTQLQNVADDATKLAAAAKALKDATNTKT
jgi:hypothetical protein